MQAVTFHQRFLGFTFAATAFLLSACSPMGNAAPAAGGYAFEAAAPAQTVVAAEQPQAMFFADYGVNGFVETAQDNLSTFGLDVDTGAYTLARSYLQAGNLPPQDAVRVEEFVNFFNYHYALPTAEETFAIDLAAAPAPFGQNAASRIVRIGIQGYDIPAAERKPVNLTFVIDVSGSMDMDNRLGLVRRALAMMVEELRPSDAVAIVVYGSTARLVLPTTPVAEKQTILNSIDSLYPDGSTNAEEGLRLGYEQAWQNFDPQALNRVILCSDGVANVGATGPDAILEVISQYAAKGIYMTSVGVGMGNYNDVLMEQLADKGDGFYAYVDTDEQARKLFVHDLTGTLQTIAKEAKVQVEFNPEVVTRYRLIGYENRDVADNDFRNDQVDGGEVGAGHSVTALYEVEVNSNGQDPQGRLATVHLRWQDPETGVASEQSQDLLLSALQTDFAQSDLSFQLAVVAAEYAEVLRGSQWSAEVSLANLLQEAQRLNDEFSAAQRLDPEVTELVDLIWRANQLAGGSAQGQ